MILLWLDYEYRNLGVKEQEQQQQQRTLLMMSWKSRRVVARRPVGGWRARVVAFVTRDSFITYRPSVVVGRPATNDDRRPTAGF